MDTPPQMDLVSQPEQKNTGTLTFKRSHLYAVLLPLAFVTGLSLGYIFWGRTPTGSGREAVAQNNPQNQATPAAPAAAQAEPVQTTRYDVPVDDDPSMGSVDAPITIIEFSDYECPYCRRWHNEVLKPLMEAYPDQIQFVYRDFPLGSIHFNAASAAEAANCAGDQDRYWEFADKVFESEALSAGLYQTIAQDLYLELESFQECVDTRKYESEVQADFDYAANLGINSTPTFFINGIALVGAQPLTVFQNVVDKELAGEIP